MVLWLVLIGTLVGFIYGLSLIREAAQMPDGHPEATPLLLFGIGLALVFGFGVGSAASVLLP